MSKEEGHIPKLDVSFAPTPAFVRRWGKHEAALQKAKFERKNWQEAPEEFFEKTAGSVLEEPKPEMVLATDAMKACGVYLAVGIGVGVALSYFVLCRR